MFVVFVGIFNHNYDFGKNALIDFVQNFLHRLFSTKSQLSMLLKKSIKMTNHFKMVGMVAI